MHTHTHTYAFMMLNRGKIHKHKVNNIDAKSHTKGKPVKAHTIGIAESSQIQCKLV